MQVLITCSLIMLTCLTWFGWVLHTFIMQRRARARRAENQLRLASAGMPVPVSVPHDILQGAHTLPAAISSGPCCCTLRCVAGRTQPANSCSTSGTSREAHIVAAALGQCAASRVYVAFLLSSFLKSSLRFAGLPEVLYKPGMDNVGDDECSICLDDLKPGTRLLRLPCGHMYHPDCIRSWFRGHNFCPLCKFVLTARHPVRHAVAAPAGSQAVPGEPAGNAPIGGGVPLPQPTSPSIGAAHVSQADGGPDGDSHAAGGDTGQGLAHAGHTAFTQILGSALRHGWPGDRSAEQQGGQSHPEAGAGEGTRDGHPVGQSEGMVIELQPMPQQQARSAELSTTGGRIGALGHPLDAQHAQAADGRGSDGQSCMASTGSRSLSAGHAEAHSRQHPADSRAASSEQGTARQAPVHEAPGAQHASRANGAAAVGAWTERTGSGQGVRQPRRHIRVSSVMPVDATGSADSSGL